MSLAISAIPSGTAPLDTLDVASVPKKPLTALDSANGTSAQDDTSGLPKKPLPSPTAAQQVQQLALTGQSPAAIATVLGIPIAQVQSDLGATTESALQASADASLIGRLSVQA